MEKDSDTFITCFWTLKGLERSSQVHVSWLWLCSKLHLPNFSAMSTPKAQHPSASICNCKMDLGFGSLARLRQMILWVGAGWIRSIAWTWVVYVLIHHADFVSQYFSSWSACVLIWKLAQKEILVTHLNFVVSNWLESVCVWKASLQCSKSLYPEFFMVRL